MLSITVSESSETPLNEPNVALAPEEIETLQSLVTRYEQVLEDIDSLSLKLQELLDTESPTKEKTINENSRDGLSHRPS